jgi:hypothetical protein
MADEKIDGELTPKQIQQKALGVYRAAVHAAINHGKVFPEGHEWAGFTGPESLAYVSRKLTAEQARAERARTAPVAVKDTGKLPVEKVKGA